jgi:ferredoxin
MRLDQVFFEKEFRDDFYAKKRENTTLVALACQKPNETCFCDSMGADPNTAPAADILLIDAGDHYGVVAQTEKGKAITELWQKLLRKGDVKPGKAACSLKTKMSEDLYKKLAGMFEHPIWEGNAKACIGCGTCTYVCPTCYCFDIKSESHGNEGVNFRCWDSCMFSDYTRMAGGHNPRPTKKERLRNRYLHKLSYFKERHGSTLCVGCGRCVEKCPAHLDITEFIDKAAEVTL